MCGRYTLDVDKYIPDIEGLLGSIRSLSDREKINTGEIFPTNIVPVFKEEHDNKVVSIMKWGFPKWDNKGVIINARMETIFDKQLFREAMLKRRCIVPSTGFYEWKDVGQSKKEKYLFVREETPMLYMAGIYNVYEKIESFVILTTKASHTMKGIHNRMPVILNEEEFIMWLTNVDFAQKMLFIKDLELVMHKVEG